MGKFKVIFYLSDNVLASEIKEGESEKEIIENIPEFGIYYCKDDKGNYYKFNVKDVKMVSVKIYKGNKVEAKPAFL